MPAEGSARIWPEGGRASFEARPPLRGEDTALDLLDRPAAASRPPDVDAPLVINAVTLRSRLFLGTGKYRSNEEMGAALAASGSELITVALRRLDLDNPQNKSLLDQIDWQKYRILPNTAGARTAE